MLADKKYVIGDETLPGETLGERRQLRENVAARPSGEQQTDEPTKRAKADAHFFLCVLRRRANGAAFWVIARRSARAHLALVCVIAAEAC